MKILLFFILFLSFQRHLYCEDWEIQGHTVHNVIVTNVEVDRVQITYDGGAGSPDLAMLSPELQKRFNYDPIKAKEAKEAREQANNQAIAEAIKLAPPKPAATPEVVGSYIPAKLAPDQIQAIQMEIQRLQEDVDQKEAEVKKNQASEVMHRINSQSGFKQLIADEKARIDGLKAQLVSEK